VPLLCQFVEGWLLQVGPDSVFEVYEALWDIELAVQVERFCEEESLAGSHPRQDNVNPISKISCLHHPYSIRSCISMV